MHMYGLWEYMPCVCRCMKMPEEGVGLPGVRVTACELPDMSMKNQTEVFG